MPRKTNVGAGTEYYSLNAKTGEITHVVDGEKTVEKARIWGTVDGIEVDNVPAKPEHGIKKPKQRIKLLMDQTTDEPWVFEFSRSSRLFSDIVNKLAGCSNFIQEIGFYAYQSENGLARISIHQQGVGRLEGKFPYDKDVPSRFRGVPPIEFYVDDEGNNKPLSCEQDEFYAKEFAALAERINGGPFEEPRWPDMVDLMKPMCQKVTGDIAIERLAKRIRSVLFHPEDRREVLFILANKYSGLFDIMGSGSSKPEGQTAPPADDDDDLPF